MKEFFTHSQQTQVDWDNLTIRRHRADDWHVQYTYLLDGIPFDLAVEPELIDILTTEAARRAAAIDAIETAEHTRLLEAIAAFLAAH